VRPPFYANPAADSFENCGADIELLGCQDDGEVKVWRDVLELHLPGSLPLEYMYPDISSGVTSAMVVSPVIFLSCNVVVLSNFKFNVDFSFI
jgi:hypothetical protein